MKRGILTLLCFAACSRTSSVRLQLALEDGAPAPDAVDVSIYDKFGGIAFGLELSATLPGDLVVLVSNDADFVRVVGHGTVAGQMVVAGVAATGIQIGQQMPLPLMLSTALPADRDGDGVPDAIDDCPDDFDPDQTDGEACAVTPSPEAPDLGAAHKPDLSQPPNGSTDLGSPPAPDLMPVVPPNCGDGIVQSGEACDNGAANSDAPAAAAGCTTTCQLRAGCGNLAGSSGAQIDVASGHCYVAWPNQVNWATASRACEGHGGHLASVTSAAENARIQTLTGLQDRWIGLKIDHGQAVRDHWVTGETVSFTSYAAGEPNNGGTGDPEACGVFESMRAAWDDRPCGFPETGALPYSFAFTAGYICENECGNGVIDPGEECEGGANCTNTCHKLRTCADAGGVNSLINGHCYFPSATLVTFSDAMNACPSGTHLATLDEIAESEAGALAAIGGDAWIALRAAVTQGSYAWTVGSDVFNSMRYHGFQGNEPNDSGAAPYCARITATAGWKDRLCDATTYLALCERE